MRAAREAPDPALCCRQRGGVVLWIAIVTHRLVSTARGARAGSRFASRLALAVLLGASLASAQVADGEVGRALALDAGSALMPAAAPLGPAAPVVLASAAPASFTAPSSNDQRWLAWAGIGVGSGLLALSVWQWVVFANENAEAGDVCPARSGGLARCADAPARARYVNARDDAKQARILAAVFGGLGAAAVVTSIVLFPEPEAGRAQLALSADPVARGARASVSWAW